MMALPMMPTQQWDIVRQMTAEELNRAAQGAYLSLGVSPVFALARIEEEKGLKAAFQAEEQKRQQAEQAKEAEAAGAYGENVRDPSEVAPALARGLEKIRGGTPAVISVWLKRLEGDD